MDSSKPPPTDEHAERDAWRQLPPSAVAFPVGLLGCAVAFDVIARLGGGDTMAVVAFRMLTVGILAAAALAAAGWWRARTAAEPRRDGGRASAVDVAVVLLFVASWFVRRAHDGLAPPAALWLGFGGAALALLAAAARHGWRQRRPADEALAKPARGDADGADFAAHPPSAALNLPPTGNAS